MDQETLKIESAIADGARGIHLLVLTGVLDPSTEHLLRDELRRMTSDAAPTRVILDFQRVVFVSSAGWGVLVSHLRRIAGGKGEVRLAGIQGRVLTSFELLGLDSAFKSYPNWRAALDEPWSHAGARAAG